MPKIKYTAGLCALILTFGLATNSYAAEHSYRQKGIVSAVDIENNTFTVFHAKTGESKTYVLPKDAKVRFDGRRYNDVSVLEPGQGVTLKFKRPASAEKTTSGVSMEIRGTVVDIDHTAKTGTLREAETDRLVKFRLSEDYFNGYGYFRNKMPRKGEKVVFVYELRGLNLTSAK